MKYLFILFIFYSSLYSNWKDERESLEQSYIFGKFRIFYTLKGKNALSDQSDKNKNNIPDFIENISSKLNESDKIFKYKLGFIYPLKNKIYKDRVDFIDIHVLDLKHNGLAGDRVIQYHYLNTKSNKKSISMSLSNSLSQSNLTPLHELFHIYQNGYSMIKNRWYTEGTARWSEYLYKNNKPIIDKKLPQNSIALQNLLNKTYDSEGFWNRLALIFGKENYFNLLGYDFMKLFLTNLQIVEKEIELKYGYKPLLWSEKNQKSKRNNKYILKAILNTINTLKYESRYKDEVENFKSSVSKYLLQ